METYYTITAADVGAPTIRAFGCTWPVSNFLGRVLPQDAGKRVYLQSGVLCSENDEQVQTRVALEENGQ